MITYHVYTYHDEFLGEYESDTPNEAICMLMQDLGFDIRYDEDTDSIDWARESDKIFTGEPEDYRVIQVSEFAA